MKALVYDSETQGLPDWRQPSEAPHQPHIVELAAKLIDLPTGELLGQMDVIIRPDGWTIPDDVAELHGITTEKALAEGIPEAEAVTMFLALHAQADTRTAFNESFDARIMRIALKRFRDDDVADAFKAAPAFCCADMATKPCAIPPTAKMVKAGRGKQFKKPTLQEAHQILVGEPLPGAHRAMVDVDGCIRVYYALNPIQA